MYKRATKGAGKREAKQAEDQEKLARYLNDTRTEASHTQRNTGYVSGVRLWGQ